jgi:hypothetical protein
LERPGSDHTIQERQLVSFLLQIHHEFSPPSTDCGVPWKAVYGLHHVRKPLLELCPLTSTWQRENAEAQFAHDNRVHDKVPFVRSQSVDNLVVGRRLRRLAEHVRIDQKGHVSFGALIPFVVSLRFNGLNQFTGQASSSFTKPWLRRRSFRFSRYSPRSIRSTSNSWPDSMPSRWRISAGRMIWPFVETVVFIARKIMSYLAKNNLTIDSNIRLLHVSITRKLKRETQPGVVGSIPITYSNFSKANPKVREKSIIRPLPRS